MSAPIRVMIVEDSVVVRQLLTHIIGRDPRFKVAAALGSAEEALAEIDKVRPDVISMDIRLPGMDGLEATRRIMAEHPTPIVVIADAVEDASLEISMNALRAGALTVVEKPVGTVTDGYERLAGTICTQLFIMSSLPVIRRRGTAEPAPKTPPPPLYDEPMSRPLRYLGLAASTGGPPALAKLLDALPSSFPAPVLLVQHMGAAFMEGFAGWLDGLTTLPVSVARDGETPQPGHVYVAPGDRHLTLGAGGALKLSDGPPVNGQRPSATVLFRSLAQVAGPGAAAVLLTGMGEDGAEGLAEMREAGAYTIAEHESTAVVYGMPAAAVRRGAARAILGLDLIGPKIVQLARRSAR